MTAEDSQELTRWKIHGERVVDDTRRRPSASQVALLHILAYPPTRAGDPSGLDER
ncbi:MULTISPECIES: hypothetical protein [Kribbella]|uniref:hypothetical protein n=1 Tax=Kribbella TaxID=182639 RepID=UPI0013053EB1|nr:MULTISPECIES: hypothetical protein [Kribbella]